MKNLLKIYLGLKNKIKKYNYLNYFKWDYKIYSEKIYTTAYINI